jgi:hypothetical protein
LIRVLGPFALPETYAQSRSDRGTNGFGFGSEHIAILIATFPAEAKGVQRSDLRGVIPIFGYILPAERVPQNGARGQRCDIARAAQR